MIPADLYTRMLEMMRDWWQKKPPPEPPTPTPEPPEPPTKTIGGAA